MPLLTQDFYSQDTEKVAKLLFGKILCRLGSGIDYPGDAAHWPLRFYIRNNPHVSKK